MRTFKVLHSMIALRGSSAVAMRGETLTEPQIEGRINGLLRKRAIEEIESEPEAPRLESEEKGEQASEKPLDFPKSGEVARVAKEKGDTPGLGKLTRKQLIELAKSRNIEVSPKATRLELIAAIEAKS